MSNLTDFVTFMYESLNYVIDLTLIGVFVIMVGAIIITELIKKFNPNIDTTEKAVEHIITFISKEEGKTVADEDVFISLSQGIKDIRLDLWIVPIIGLGFTIMICDNIFPHYAARLIETVMIYYIPFVPHIAVFVSLYIIGSTGINAVMFIGGKSIKLISVLVTKYKEIEKEEKENKK